MCPHPSRAVAAFEKLGFGLFLHWGLYSLEGRAEWVMHHEGIPAALYAKLKDRFTAEEFDGRALARLARDSGMRYITLTSAPPRWLLPLRHPWPLRLRRPPHPGKTRPHQGLRRRLPRRRHRPLPLPHHPRLALGLRQLLPSDDFDEYLDYLHKSVEILCTHYGPIGGLWFDGNWSRKDADWKEDRLYSMIRRYQPQAIIVNNTGLQARGQTGHPEIDSRDLRAGPPDPMDRRGMSKYVAAEMCQTMNQHWGIGMSDFMYKSPARLIEDLCACRKVGANLLLNVGPTAAGAVPEYETAALHTIGRWIAINGRAVYDAKPTDIACDGRDFVLRGDDGVYYYFVHDLRGSGDANVVVGGPAGPGQRTLGNFPGPAASAKWLDADVQLVKKYDPAAGALTLDCSGFPYGSNLVVRVAELRLAQ